MKLEDFPFCANKLTFHVQDEKYILLASPEHIFFQQTLPFHSNSLTVFFVVVVVAPEKIPKLYPILMPFTFPTELSIGVSHGALRSL